MRRREWVDCIHCVAVRGYSSVADQRSVCIEVGDEICRRIVKAWRAGADEPKMIEKPATKRGMEEPIGQRVFSSQLVEPQRATIEVTHWQRSGTRHSNKLVHLAIVDLFLLLVEAMYEVDGSLPQTHVLIGAEWTVR
jgi:hypothetical protein